MGQPVLLIEDNPGDARLISELLREAGEAVWQVVWVTRLADGLTRLASNGIDAVLLDLELPDSQGLATVAAVHNQAPLVPIVVLSGLGDEALVTQAVQAGAQDYLVKGRIDGALLSRALRYAVERQQARNALAGLAQQREEFLAIAAHELRTPLTTLRGYTQICERLLAQSTLDRDRLGRTHAALQHQVGRLEGLVADLLDATRLQHGQLALRRQPMDLTELARRVLEQVAEAPEWTPRHTLHLDAPLPVVGEWDGDRLEQVLTNLVSNALKYSPDGGVVRVAVAADGALAVVTVSDQGIGIAPGDQTRLFQPFGRGERAGRRIQSMGLGLYITAQIVARHGGTIAVESTPGRGSTFAVRLPLGPPPAGDGG
jgi:signal transduction histidine kinase